MEVGDNDWSYGTCKVPVISEPILPILLNLISLSTTLTYGNVLPSNIGFYDIFCFIRVI